MAANIITTEDLQIFKKELIEEIKTIFLQDRGLHLKQYLKTSQLRKLVPFSAGTLQNIRDNGTLPYTRIGGVIFYAQEDIQKMMDEHKVKHPIADSKFKLK